MSRDKIIARVREALAIKSDPHVRAVLREPSHALPVLSNGPEHGSKASKEFLPFVGNSYEEHKTAFRTLSDKLQTEFVCVKDIKAAHLEINRRAQNAGWKRAGVHRSDLVREVTQNLDLEFVNTSDGYDVCDLEKCDVGISTCDALIAQTASVLVTTQSAGGRALSVLPPHHIVIATADQMVTTMADGFDVLRSKHGDDWPSFISFISGPSRTADIERVLVLGAHGPKKLTVILIES